MKYYIENQTYGLADINLYDGTRITLVKKGKFYLKHIPTEAEKRYYSKLACLGIILRSEVCEETASEKPVEPSKDVEPPTDIVEEVTSVDENTTNILDEVDETDDEVKDTDVVDDNTENEVNTETVDYTTYKSADLMKLRQAELIKIAHELGSAEVDETYPKKDIVKIIRGE